MLGLRAWHLARLLGRPELVRREALGCQGTRLLQCCRWLQSGLFGYSEDDLSRWPSSASHYAPSLPAFSQLTPYAPFHTTGSVSSPDFQDHYKVRQLVMTASGPDRPGIVSRLSKRLLELGGNVEESRMARLAGDFSILMLVTVDATVPSRAEEIRSSLSDIEGLHVFTRWTSEDPSYLKKLQKRFRRISLRGADNPGLVYNVTEYLASLHVNIESLETGTEEAPFGGTTLFMMDGIVAIPPDISTARLASDLDALQTTLGVDITVTNMEKPGAGRTGGGNGGGSGSSRGSATGTASSFPTSAQVSRASGASDGASAASESKQYMAG
ncbi:hypothetical protein KFL_004550090 [Klebsormidium nitens]|uniref:ACT domain-containing protein n=1 Tax=Klebsormidium nitens TaxID=105231 RepID=A0A1Y1IKX5_KLENI|nr:hypothetical protein KFL_004550090 [Klebsormidium nitens]|eukprot:GAQ88738.1 hypothetical protein KFL_004550090 [Klebsormidium nitens]